VKAGVADFGTTYGNFSTKLGPGVKIGDTAKLYVRPEHCSLQRTVAKNDNSIPVETSEVAFEGNFVNVFVRDSFGTIHMVQAQNDPNQPPPVLGAKVNMAFAAENAVVLSDAVTGGHG